MDSSVIESLKSQVAALEWYHTIDLGGGIITPGHYDHRAYLPFYGLPVDLAGKTALDIGAASGFFSFELERRGARVTATDLPDWMAHDFGPHYRSGWSPEAERSYLHDPFALARDALHSQVEKREISIYDISPATVGRFDLVFCGSVLLHLSDPLRALWRLQSVTGEMAIIATAIQPEASEDPQARFVGHQSGGDTWWVPNRACLEAMLQATGFTGWEWVSEFRLDPQDGRAGFHHGVLRAWNTAGGQRPALADHGDRAPRLAQRMETVSDWRWTLAQRDAEIASLRQLLAAYESGRFIRLMKWMRRRP